MKKILLFTAALAALLSAASCQKEEMGAVEAGNGNVTFTIQTPEDAVTKAIGDGTNVNIVYYEIYKADEKGQPVGEPLVDDTVEMSNKEASLTLNLLEDQKYVALFWAQVNGKDYYDVRNLLKVEALYPDTKSNLEERAAFYQKFVFSTENAVNETVTLVRPFAQLNIGTTLESLDMDYEVDVTASSVTVANPARFFNVNNGVGHTATPAAVVFGEETNPQEALIVNNDEYEYVAMNYILVDGARSTVNVDFSIVTDKGTVTKTVADVPVAQNYRTNLLGNLLTKETKIEIVVDERFNTPDLEPNPLVMAAAIGGEYTLTENVTLSEPLKVESSLVLDLNGYTISAGLKQEGRHHYAIDNYGNLTLKGKGYIEGRGVENFGTMFIEGDITITNLDTNGGSAIWNEGDLVINGGTFTTNSAAGEGSSGSALNTQANGTAVINGGNFIANSQLTYAILNYGETVINNAVVTGKHGAVAAAEGDIKTVINGGTFSLMENPGVSDHCLYYVSDIKGGTFTLGNNTDSGAKVFYSSTIADGYKAVETAAGVYTVIPNSAVIAATSDEVNAALKQENVDIIYLNAGTYTIDMYSNFTFKESLTFIGTKDTKVEFTNKQVRLELCRHFTIKNCEILKMKDKGWGMMVFSTGVSADGVYTVSNCTFKGVGTQGIFINETRPGAIYNIENCTFNGDFGSADGAVTIQNNRGVAFTVNVTGCTFNMTNGSHEISHHYNDSAFTLNTDVDPSKIYCKEN